MAMAVVPEAVGEAMLTAFAQNAAYEAEMAALLASEAEGAAAVTAMEAELAAEAVFESSLEAAEAFELAGGPLGWIAAAVTGGLILATAVTLVFMMDKIAQSNASLDQIRDRIAKLPKLPPLPVVQSPPPKSNPIPKDPFVEAVFNTAFSPSGYLDPYFNQCKYPFTSDHCRRLRKKR